MSDTIKEQSKLLTSRRYHSSVFQSMNQSMREPNLTNFLNQFENSHRIEETLIHNLKNYSDWINRIYRMIDEVIVLAIEIDKEIKEFTFVFLDQ